MNQYRPDVGFQKLRYSMMKSRATLRRLQGKSDAPDPNRKLGYTYLQELASEGDPYAAEYLREEPAPYETLRHATADESARVMAWTGDTPVPL